MYTEPPVVRCMYRLYIYHLHGVNWLMLADASLLVPHTSPTNSRDGNDLKTYLRALCDYILVPVYRNTPPNTHLIINLNIQHYKTPTISESQRGVRRKCGTSNHFRGYTGSHVLQTGGRFKVTVIYQTSRISIYLSVYLSIYIYIYVCIRDVWLNTVTLNLYIYIIIYKIIKNEKYI